jgi:hypothetical protein
MSESGAPKWPEYALAAFALLLCLGSATSLWNGEAFWHGGGVDPFLRYHANRGIQSIAIAALATNLLVVVIVVLWRLGRVPSKTAHVALPVGCAIAAVLPWLELWWGSTFYYGEVRDKQGLPFGVTNAGPLGTTLFLTYIALRLPLPGVSMTRGGAMRVAFIVGIVVLEGLLLGLVEGPWNLSQS